MKRVFLILAVTVLAGLGLWAYLRHRAELRFGNGEVVALPDMGGQNSSSAAADAGQPTTEADGHQPDQSQQAQPSQVLATNATQPAGQPSRPASAVLTATTTGGPLTPPATDSIAPNPPNGAAFAGTGRYQVYRQGNLTWRVNTDNGSTCILFATNEEWRKPIVYSHGCSAS